MFFSRSADKPPGKGVNEQILTGTDYSNLKAVKDWRKMLSNFYESKFKLDGHKWLSVEHYYQGSKFRKGHPEFFYQFSLDSGSDISKSPVLAKSAGGKSGKRGGKQIRPKHIKMDSDFFRKVDKGLTYPNVLFRKAMYAKFSQNPILREVLLATGNAQLLHRTRGVPLHRVYDLEAVRKKLHRKQ